MTAETAQPLAIDGGAPVRATPWPQDPRPEPASDPDPAHALAEALAEQLAVPAAHVRLFADGATAAVAALRAALASGGMTGDPAGGEVLVPAIGAHAWARAALDAGFTPVPVEIDPETAALAPRAVAAAMRASPSVRAVVATHPFGHPAALTELERVIGPASLPLIEDATAALGASERGRPAGTVGAAGLFRIGAPREDAPYALVAANPPEDEAAPLAEPAARAALAWLRTEPDALAHRRRLAWELTFGVRGMRGVAGMHHGRYVRTAYHDYVARLRRIVWKRPLEATLDALRAEGIPCDAAFTAPALPGDPDVRTALGADDPRLADDAFPVAERLPAEWIAIPLPATGTQREVDDAIAALRKLEAAGA